MNTYDLNELLHSTMKASALSNEMMEQVINDLDDEVVLFFTATDATIARYACMMDDDNA